VDTASEIGLPKALVEVEGKIGKQDGYQLVGEAYVERVMNWEVEDRVRNQVKRYSFLEDDGAGCISTTFALDQSQSSPISNYS
jgi:hypothetical protein